MALYKYTKEKPVRRSNRPHKSNVVLQLQRDPLTVWRLISGFTNDVKEIITTSRLAGTIIPAIFIIIGINLLWNQIIPTIVGYLQDVDQGNVSLVKGDYISQKQLYLSQPGSDYFAQLQTNAFSTNVLLEDIVSNNYNGKFKLSIANIGLKDLPVQANVNSGIDDVYNKVLENGLAHMQYTGLPISTVKNNIVVYGHSAGGDYFKRTGDPAAAFSVLNKIKVGDEINITMEGKNYIYKVSKTKVVKPYDIEIITGNNSRVQTLTLFTCFPAGNNANRLVVVANPI